MSVLKPDLVWIGGACFRKNHVENRSDYFGRGTPAQPTPTTTLMTGLPAAPATSLENTRRQTIINIISIV